MGCLFCKIVSGQIPSEKVYEDELFIAILDINPINKGHLLVIPKRHSENIFDMEEPELSKIFSVLQFLSKAVTKAVKSKGVNIIQNNGADAGQIIFHSHIHIIPRHPGDEIKIGMVHGKYEGNEIKEYGELIRKEIK